MTSVNTKAPRLHNVRIFTCCSPHIVLRDKGSIYCLRTLRCFVHAAHCSVCWTILLFLRRNLLHHTSSLTIFSQHSENFSALPKHFHQNTFMHFVTYLSDVDIFKSHPPPSSHLRPHELYLVKLYFRPGILFYTFNKFLDIRYELSDLRHFYSLFFNICHDSHMAYSYIMCN
jgi:hypothetical protein